MGIEPLVLLLPFCETHFQVIFVMWPNSLLLKLNLKPICLGNFRLIDEHQIIVIGWLIQCRSVIRCTLKEEIAKERNSRYS